MPDNHFLTPEEYKQREQDNTLTICAKCSHFLRLGNIWYQMFCKAPQVQRPLGIDPVSGEKSYITRNSLGLVVFTDKSEPHARDINTHGQCPHYQAKA